MNAGVTACKTGPRILARARVVGHARSAPVVRAPSASLVASGALPRLLRTSAYASNTYEHTPAPTNNHLNHLGKASLGLDVEPSQMLTFVNSPEFSPYHSTSNEASTLLGDNESLAATALTHESWKYGLQGHNRRLAFLGRRALKTYLSLYFFHILSESRRASAPENDILTLQHILAEPHGVDNMLRTQQLGDHVGRALQLERVMRWQPSTVRALYDSHQHTDSAHGSLESGLFKVRGTCVEALVGAIYHYRGARTAQQFFLACIVPHLNLEARGIPASLLENEKSASSEAAEALAHSP